ncbi:MAG TPA: DUF4012 domain-containing protein, partial [Ktedonobacterales bacterium]|nr:DUF4012 domain-containing protein [Ktedonobacterales bacterium]
MDEDTQPSPFASPDSEPTLRRKPSGRSGPRDRADQRGASSRPSRPNGSSGAQNSHNGRMDLGDGPTLPPRSDPRSGPRTTPRSGPRNAQSGSQNGSGKSSTGRSTDAGASRPLASRSTGGASSRASGWQGDGENSRPANGRAFSGNSSRPLSGSPSGSQPVGAQSAVGVEDMPTLHTPQTTRPNGLRGRASEDFAPTPTQPVSRGVLERLGIDRWLRTPLDPEQARRRRRIQLISAITAAAVLITLLVPALVAGITAYQDYEALKTLGEDGVAHLEAIRTDLSGILPTSTASGSAASSTISNNLCQRIMAGDLPSSLSGVLAPDVQNPAYTLMVQRQGGSFYNVNVTIHPAKGISAEGTKPVTYKLSNYGTNSAFTIGGTPVPGASATPTVTATATPGSSGATASKHSINSALLQKIRQDLVAAEQDFAQLQARLTHPDWLLSMAGAFGYGQGLLTSAKALAAVGIDISQMGILLIDSVMPIVNRLHGVHSILSSAKKIILPADITRIQGAIAQSATLLTDVQHRLAGVDVNSLPLSAKQKTLLGAITPQLPCIHTAMEDSITLVGAFGWLIGVSSTRNFMVETLDRSEMRASGGFAGNVGVVTVDDGHLGPITLYDAGNQFDYSIHNGIGYTECQYYHPGCGGYDGNRPGAQYAWWPFANWGLRDGNLSPDYPTTAQMLMNLFQNENEDLFPGVHSVDGVIQISPVAIAHVLLVTGPIFVPKFNVTVTAANLEDELHYYEENPQGIAIDEQLYPNSTRKIFTQIVEHMLETELRQLPLGELLHVAKQALSDMRSHDLLVYLANPTLENILHTLHADGSIDSSPNVDGFYFTQTNVSISKSSPYETVNENDDVQLDSKGGATHHLTISIQFQLPRGTYRPVDGVTTPYGYTTLRDYVRIYAPADARLISADGFDTERPMCWAAPGESPGEAEPAAF